VAKARHQTVIRLLRGSLAVALLLFVALVGLYLFGRQGKPETEKPEAAEGSNGDFAVRGEGFEFALTKGDKVVFEIRGREQRSDRSGKVYLEDVLIAMERSDGPYRVQGKSAIYDQGTQEARLQGKVVIRGPRGLQIETERLDLGEEGNRVHAHEGVRFASGQDLRGRADALDVDLEGRTLVLAGSIAVVSPTTAKVPWSLETEELVFREAAASAVARGGVLLRSGSSWLRAQRLNLFFDQDTRELDMARFLSNVEGMVATAPGGEPAVATASLAPAPRRGKDRGNPLTVRATSLEVHFDGATGQPVEIDLRGLERRPARVVQTQPDQSIATLTTVSLIGTFENGVLVRADLNGPVWLTQGGLRSRRGAERQVKAANGEARFDRAQGGLEGVTLIGDVSLRDADAEANGDRAYVDMRRETFEIIGAPAHLQHPRGTLDAPHAVYRRDAGIVQADGGVAAVLIEGGKALAPGLAGGAESDEPLRVESREAIWQAEPSSVRFLGGVRAWQGENTLFADQLRGEPDRGWMAASGGVRTLWQQPPEEETAEEGTAKPATDDDSEVENDGEERPTGPLEITSAEMSYSESEALLVYTGAVKAVQDWTTLNCDRMTVVLEEDGSGTEEIQCETAVRIVDSRNQRTLEGDRAIYYPEVPEVEVFGDPLTMQDAAGNKVEGGRHFVYDLESGSSRLTAAKADAGR
jgi:lipopolysaccharide export system protein LptA